MAPPARCVRPAQAGCPGGPQRENLSGVEPRFAGPARRYRTERRLHRCHGQCDRRGRLQHRDDRLPGDPDGPLLLPPDRHPDLSAHRQYRGDARGPRVAAHSRRGAGHPRPAAAALQLARRRAAGHLPEARQGGRHRRARYPPAHPHAAREGRPGRLHHDRRGRRPGRRGARGPQVPGPQGHGPRQGRERAPALPVDRGQPVAAPSAHGAQRHAPARGGLRLRHQAQHPAAAVRLRLPRDGGAGEDAGRGRAGARAGRRVPVERAGRSRAVRLRHRGDTHAARQQASRCSASASGTSCWRWPAARAPSR